VRYPLRFESADEVKASVDASIKSMDKLNVAIIMKDTTEALEATLAKDTGASPF